MSGVGDARFSQFEHGPNQSLTSGMVDDNSALNDLQRELQGTHEVIKTLGRGACGRVILARDVRLPTRPLVAIKLIERGNFVSASQQNLRSQMCYRVC